MECTLRAWTQWWVLAVNKMVNISQSQTLAVIWDKQRVHTPISVYINISTRQTRHLHLNEMLACCCHWGIKKLTLGSFLQTDVVQFIFQGEYWNNVFNNILRVNYNYIFAANVRVAERLLWPSKLPSRFTSFYHCEKPWLTFVLWVALIRKRHNSPINPAPYSGSAWYLGLPHHLHPLNSGCSTHKL